jgi:hypothetical protein
VSVCAIGRGLPSGAPLSDALRANLLAEPEAQSASAAQIRAETAGAFVDVNNMARKTPNVRVIGDATACVTASSVSAIASGNVDVSSEPLAKKAARKAWPTYPGTISPADLDYRRGVCGAKGCDRHTVCSRCAESADSKRKKKHLFHCLSSQYGEQNFSPPTSGLGSPATASFKK